MYQSYKPNTKPLNASYVGVSYEGPPPSWELDSAIKVSAEVATDETLNNRENYGELLDIINEENEFRKPILDALYALFQLPTDTTDTTSSEAQAINLLRSEIEDSVYSYRYDEIAR